MSGQRGEKRNRAGRRARGESNSSKKYRSGGKLYGYKYRVHGPTFPVKTYLVGDGPTAPTDDRRVPLEVVHDSRSP